MQTILWIACYLVAVNLLGFAIMGIDKSKAKKRAFRISEATLFIVAIIGGSIGSILGMQIFRHKTKHWYFKFGMPFILLIQLAFVAFLHFSPLVNISFM